MNHTPGPWYLSQDGAGSVVCSKQATPAQVVGVRYLDVIARTDWGRGAEDEANAVLIVASPELLEACKAQHQAIDMLLARVIELDHDFLPSKSAVWPMLLQGNAAIAKAEEKS